MFGEEDGLTEDAIDALIAQAADEVADLPPATSALLDGSALRRRDRREERRTLGGTVRVLRTFVPLSGPMDNEAA
ncbi:hypothetical protein [Saccharothrix yanglingensis]|uniref:Transposase n=1 Tax=Saccharothrix yanglingensis TaxID=659496 RepID=A0ABU0WRY8_9PSEU|nr:hypothetical protein [Saccharothrix yanglingensis]MDQ2582600.1 hypothetical protein [Saccharothrix yanglingensis]